MAITSSKITNLGKFNITKLLTNTSPDYYIGIGVGNDTNAALETQTGLLGDETSFKDGNVSNFSSTNNSYIAQWNSTFVFADLTTHIFREVVVCENASNNTGVSLLRGVYDAVTLGASDSLALTVQISVDEQV